MFQYSAVQTMLSPLPPKNDSSTPLHVCAKAAYQLLSSQAAPLLHLCALILSSAGLTVNFPLAYVFWEVQMDEIYCPTFL